jgi:hypothetical protein
LTAYISIPAVMAPYGFALTASHLEERVGAKLLAMNLRAPRGVRCPASSLTTIASMLAPTGPAAMGGGKKIKSQIKSLCEAAYRPA